MNPGNSATSDAITALPSSFRDPMGFVFRHHGVVFRQVNQAYAEHYDHLMSSGLYDALTRRGWLVTHDEVDEPVADPDKAYRILRPEPIGFVSYPYEWSFSQLKDAALLTLGVQQLALQHDMSMSDASAYNIQFRGGRPVMIDTLSFQRYTEGASWDGYRQFCQHFLAPLALMAKTDIRLGQLLRIHLDGIPLDLASRLLPRTTWLSPALATHVHVHARTQKAHAATDQPKTARGSRFDHVSRRGLLGIIEGLRGAIHKLDWQPAGTEWGDYYQATNYSDSAFDRKQALVRTLLEQAAPASLWDLGANTGVFSRIGSRLDIPTIAFDIDPAAVEANYRQVREHKEADLLPLLLDLSNPSPGLGWNETERDSLRQRGPVDCAMALALIHHLAISNNLPFARIADFFAGICRHLVIEFVPKNDSQVQRLLRSREDIFDEYDQPHFERAFQDYFSIQRAEPIEGSTRVLYLMERK